MELMWQNSISPTAFFLSSTGYVAVDRLALTRIHDHGRCDMEEVDDDGRRGGEEEECPLWPRSGI